MRSLVLAIMCLLSAPAHPGPDSTSLYLLQTPVPWMDFGLSRISRFLATAEISATASYRFDDDEISIFILIDYVADSQSGAENACIAQVALIRATAGILNGKPTYDHSSFAAQFKPNGYINSDSPEDLLMKIDDKIHINCWANYSDDELLVVRAKLLGTDHFVKK